MNIGIIGLGLIGGSMAKSIKSRTAHTVYGIDLEQETMMMARMCGAIDAPLTDETLPQCDLILIAIRPRAAIEWVRSHASLIATSAIVIDLCGVKRTVVNRITPIAEEYGFSYIGYLTNDNNEVSFEINWEWLYGSLPTGTYRILKQAYSQYISIEFEIQ